MFAQLKRLKRQIKKTPLANQKGMTLIEIMIVLAIIGALMAVLLPGITSRLDKSRISETKIAMGQVVNQLNMYYNDCGKFPQSLEGLTKPDADCSNWGPEPYFKTLPRDGWKRDFTYTIEGNSYVLKSFGSDGREGGDGYGKDITSEELN